MPVANAEMRLGMHPPAALMGGMVGSIQVKAGHLTAAVRRPIQ